MHEFDVMPFGDEACSAAWGGGVRQRRMHPSGLFLMEDLADTVLILCNILGKLSLCGKFEIMDDIVVIIITVLLWCQ